MTTLNRLAKLWLAAGFLGISLGNAAGVGDPCESPLCRLVTADRHSTPSVRKFYESAGYKLAWTHNGVPTKQALSVVDALKATETKGLNPEAYEASTWDARLKSLSSEAAQAEFDLNLTLSLMRYISDLHFGRANPGLFHTSSGTGGELGDLATFLRQRVVDSADVKAVLEAVEPPYPGYQRTEEAFQRYLVLAAGPLLPRLPVTPKPVEPGATYAGSGDLVTILRRLSDLSADAAIPDTSRYEGPLVDAVRHFQTRHGLDPDGRLGKSTFAQLNTPLSTRVRQLQLTLERWRWAPHSFPRPPIVVNIPEFELRTVNAAYRTDLEMKVVTGKAYGRKTPVFSADMNYVVFRPYWDVPYSITRNEMLPKMEHDAAYLAKNQLEIVDAQGRVLAENTPDADTIARLRSGALRIRQLPGPENSLGLVKFLFPNEHSVYLHSTPATNLFSKSRRDFSHGCIRVEKPEELALWILKSEGSEWTPDRIHQAMEGGTTFQVTLKNPIPVLIVYATAIVTENGEVHFFDDIYKEDIRLAAALALTEPLSAAR